MRTDATEAGGPVGPSRPFPQPRRAAGGSRARPTGSRARDRPRGRGGRTAYASRGRDASLDDSPISVTAFDVHSSALPPPSGTAGVMGGRGRPRPGAVRTSRARRLVVRSVPPRPSLDARRGGRSRRGILLVRRGHRLLLASESRRPRRRLLARRHLRPRRWSVLPQARLLPLLAASRLHYAKRHHNAIGAIVERVGIGVGEGLRTIVGRGEPATGVDI